MSVAVCVAVCVAVYFIARVAVCVAACAVCGKSGQRALTFDNVCQ